MGDGSWDEGGGGGEWGVRKGCGDICVGGWGGCELGGW